MLYAIADGRLLGVLAVEDEIRPSPRRLSPTSSARVSESDDHGRLARAVAESVARRLGIDEIAAEVLPADKAEAVKRFQAGGRGSPWWEME